LSLQPTAPATPVPSCCHPNPLLHCNCMQPLLRFPPCGSPLPHSTAPPGGGNVDPGAGARGAPADRRDLHPPRRGPPRRPLHLLRGAPPSETTPALSSSLVNSCTLILFSLSLSETRQRDGAVLCRQRTATALSEREETSPRPARGRRRAAGREKRRETRRESTAPWPRARGAVG